MARAGVQVQGGPWRGGPSVHAGAPGHHQPLKLGGNLSQDAVDAHLWFSGVGLLAHGAGELLAVVPVALQAGLAEAVAARCGDGLHEHLQTDGAGELVLGEDSAPVGAHVWET